jgi:pimeloyl-ACP methyl ester carboxylesterase
VVVESTFSSLADVARSALGAPAAWIAGSRLDSLEAIAELQSPVLVIHGDVDRIVPLELGRRLHDAAPEPRQFEIIRGAGHNDTVEVGGHRYVALLRTFIQEAAPAPADAAAAD